jgi:hypothetical protein
MRIPGRNDAAVWSLALQQAPMHNSRGRAAHPDISGVMPHPVLVLSGAYLQIRASQYSVGPFAYMSIPIGVEYGAVSYLWEQPSVHENGRGFCAGLARPKLKATYIPPTLPSKGACSCARHAHPPC